MTSDTSDFTVNITTDGRRCYVHVDGELYFEAGTAEEAIAACIETESVPYEIDYRPQPMEDRNA